MRKTSFHHKIDRAKFSVEKDVITTPGANRWEVFSLIPSCHVRRKLIIYGFFSSAAFFYMESDRLKKSERLECLHILYSFFLSFSSRVCLILCLSLPETNSLCQ
ncbi:hypothetical protein CEXT_668061 [Caerostris extrusa]|uniref:Uncharacterized protein n=1 Tax=Caerostris extrusa TaxID=172846 RepID=A0AAV4NT89_CAEEX|nr:hypothetical protein CEXT_668061 [Caerostris extrusa]